MRSDRSTADKRTGRSVSFRRVEISVPAAFLGVVLIWATTPLAIQWSSEGAGSLFGVAARMVLGVVVCPVLVALLSRRMHWHRDALLTYLAAGIGLWGAMTSVYWSARR